MSELESPFHVSHGGAEGPSLTTPLDSVLAEAGRQLTICNACRYCEGVCPVFPALERRTELSRGDINHLSNLCHDCRACYDACMYNEPHEFALNIPEALSAVRLADYEHYVWPRQVPRPLRGLPGLFVGSVASVALFVLIAVLHAGWSSLVSSHGHALSPYRLIPYGVLLALMLLASVFALIVMVSAGVRSWKEAGKTGGPLGPRPVAMAVWQSLALPHLRGGGADCYYPDDEQPSPARRRLHIAVVAGFGLCLLSTISAGVLQDILGSQPPYSWVSVPVLSGTLGGAALIAGCVGLLILKTRASPVTSLAAMTVKDYGLLTALTFLAASGIAVLLARASPAFGLLLLVHLAALLQCFVMAPYTKFVHAVFRFAALVRDNAERLCSTV